MTLQSEMSAITFKVDLHIKRMIKPCPSDPRLHNNQCVALLIPAMRGIFGRDIY